jgi:hypothetical protein
VRCKAASHLEALAWAATLANPGPFLEMGGGWFSTPLLHGVCAATTRTLLTLDSSSEWVEELAQTYATDWHEVRHEATASIPREHWALALVDGAAEHRAVHVRALRGMGMAGPVVVHDVEPEVLPEYPGLAQALDLWPHQVRFTRLIPHTVVLFP